MNKKNMFVTLTAQDHPSVFSEESDHRVSPRYKHINTFQIIDTISPLGWTPTSIRMGKRNRMGLNGGLKNNTCKHVVRFRHINEDLDAECIPEIVLINSHDRSSRLWFCCGLFEIVCENGLISQSEGYSIKLRHVGVDNETIVTAVESLITRFPRLIKDRLKYKGIMLNTSQCVEFATKAAKLRIGGENEINPLSLLTVRYESQREGNLWNIFNRVQNSLISGGFSVTNFNRKRQVIKARQVKSINSLVEINAGMWELLEETASQVSN